MIFMYPWLKIIKKNCVKLKSNKINVKIRLKLEEYGKNRLDEVVNNVSLT